MYEYWLLAASNSFTTRSSGITRLRTLPAGVSSTVSLFTSTAHLRMPEKSPITLQILSADSATSSWYDTTAMMFPLVPVRCYLFCQFGLRFSAKAFGPSM